MNWLTLGAAFAKLLAAIVSLWRDRRIGIAAEAQGRAASDAAHAREAEARAAHMREIAAAPPSRGEIEKRLEEGRA
jgi:hypothetical protein